MLFVQRFDDVAYAVQYVFRAVGEVIDVLLGGDTAENQHRVYVGFDARNDVGIHAVADEGDVLAVTAEKSQTVSKHNRVGLAHKICLLARCDLNGSNK